jgi:hypothetical protein
MVFRKTDPCVYMGGEKVCWRASKSSRLHASGLVMFVHGAQLSRTHLVKERRMPSA